MLHCLFVNVHPPGFIRDWLALHEVQGTHRGSGVKEVILQIEIQSMNAVNSHKLTLYTAILGQKAWGWGWRKWKCRGGGKLRKRAKGNNRLKGEATWIQGLT